MSNVAVADLRQELFTGSSANLQPGSEWKVFSASFLKEPHLLAPDEEYIGLGTFIGELVSGQLPGAQHEIVQTIGERFIKAAVPNIRAAHMDDRHNMARRGITMGHAIVKKLREGI
jgi:hypothetical protein